MVTKRQNRHVRHPERTRQRILEAATFIFAKFGPAGARVDDIVRMARVNKRMVYHYFGSKENLYEAVLRQRYDQAAKEEADVAAEFGSPKEQIESLLRHYFNFLDRHPQYVALLTWENLNEARSLDRANLHNVKNPIQSHFERVIREGIRMKVFRKDISAQQLLISCYALCFYTFSNQHTLSRILGVNLASRQMKKERLDHIIGIVLEGILR
jgi:TetR/AcrR family transcriptional regulator